MIYTDGIHLVTDANIDELLSFARKIRLERDWFQDHHRHPHYDILSKRIMMSAGNAGAKMVTSRDIVRICRKASD